MTQTTDNDTVLNRTEAMRRLEESRRNMVVAIGFLVAAHEDLAYSRSVDILEDIEHTMAELTDP